MKYYFIAGEASGDLHASKVIAHLTTLDLTAKMQGVGGNLMEDAGMTLTEHYKNTSFMGFVEVLKNLPTIFDLFARIKKDILQFKPDVLILVDYPGFNLRIAEWAFKQNIKVHYYISPQIWAWKESRIHKIKAFIDSMFVILPFEKEFYQKWDYNVDFVGHPLIDEIHERSFLSESEFNAKHNLPNKPIIALLPGSRGQEISRVLPILLTVCGKFKAHQFIIAGAPHIEGKFYETIIKNQSVKVIVDDTYNLLNQSVAALVTSGTATLETALFKVPQIVCYKGNSLSYQIGKKLIKVKYISLVNLIMDELVVAELIQDDLNTERLVEELELLIYQESKIQKLQDKYIELIDKLGNQGASKKTAELIYAALV